MLSRFSVTVLVNNLATSFHAGLCVSNFFMFFNDALQTLDESVINQAEKLSDKEMKELFEQGKWILRCAKVFAEWSPRVNSEVWASTGAKSPGLLTIPVQIPTRKVRSEG